MTQANLGIAGKHRQAMCLIALKQEFKERLKESPIYLLGLVGEIEIVNRQIRILE